MGRIGGILGKVAVVGAILGTLGPLVGHSVADATTTVANCPMSGTATFTSGPGSSQSFSYGFSASLGVGKSTCSTTIAGAPSTGEIYVGENMGWVDASGASHVVKLPAASGSGMYYDQTSNSCIASQSSGWAVVNWNDGGYTVVQYNTSSTASGIQVSGVVQHFLLPGSLVYDTNGVVVTVTTTEPAYPPGMNFTGNMLWIPTGGSCSSALTSALVSGTTQVVQP